MAKEVKTNAMRILEKNKVAYESYSGIASKISQRSGKLNAVFFTDLDIKHNKIKCRDQCGSDFAEIVLCHDVDIHVAVRSPVAHEAGQLLGDRMIIVNNKYIKFHVYILA